MKTEQIFMMTVLIGMILFVGFLPTDLGKPDGIYPIGGGQGLVLCGESITLNAHAGIEEKDMYDMFDEAMLVIEENCHER